MRKRSRYRPRPVCMDPVGEAIGRASVLDASQRRDLAEPMQRAFDNLRTGTRPQAAWCNLADACNVAEALAEMGIASDRLDEFRAAQQALADIHARSQDRGSYAMRGPEVVALERAIELHRIQMDYATQGEVMAAITTVKRRVQQALRGNAARSTLVVGALGQAA